ncbi:MAG: aminoglycoside phosphotransferase family protein [Alphaproteobacteria bacterium]|nr:aminoglycoside phosphotransferase family protein [Alphaproteobacteria bacterium]
MSADSIDFVMVKQNKSKKEPLFGRGTTVSKRVASDMLVAEKTVNPNGVYAKNHQKWFDKNVRAKKIADEIRQKNNPAYFVPKTFISHGKVREEFVDAVLLRDVPKDWLAKNRDWIDAAVAEFINDMSELRHVQQYAVPNNSLCFLEVENLAEFQKFLDTRGVDFIAHDDKITLTEIYEFLRDLPDNQEAVFGHNDLHQKNIMIDMKNKRLYIIDFELAGWRPKIWGLYCQIGSAKIWNKVNKLPRTTNPDLKWNFNHDIYNLVLFMRWFQAEMQKDFDNERLKKKIHDNCEIAKKFLILAASDMKTKKGQNVNSAALVLASFYQKD